MAVKYLATVITTCLCLLVINRQQAFAQDLHLITDSFFKAGVSAEVLVAHKGKTLLHKVAGYRDFERDQPLKKNDIFELASISKQFTAMIIMMLAQKNQLKLDDPMELYVPLPYQGVTIRHLLHHTSGLPDYLAIMDAHWDKQKVAGNTEILHYLRTYKPPVLFAPGEQYAYSNTGYVVLASIAEKASGQDFLELCRSWIFKPLRMRNTDIRNPAQRQALGNFALGHLPDSLGNYVHATRFAASDYTIWLGNRKGPGRISSTVTDLLKWDKALYTQKLVTKALKTEAFTAGRLNHGKYTGYGFGWVTDTTGAGKRRVGHNGSNPGYSTQIWRYLDDKYTIVVLCNNAHPLMPQLVNRLCQWVEQQ